MAFPPSVSSVFGYPDLHKMPPKFGKTEYLTVREDEQHPISLQYAFQPIGRVVILFDGIGEKFDN